MNMDILEDKTKGHTLSMRACGLRYHWEDGVLSIFANNFCVSHHPATAWAAHRQMEEARNAHFNFLEDLNKPTIQFK